jgi:hypothetical protein
MPTWGNTDNHNQKPKWDREREVRQTVSLTTANTTNIGNTVVTLVYNDGAQNNVANIGVAVGQYVYFVTGTAGNGYPGFFESNTQVTAISGNNVVLNNGSFNTTPAGAVATFDTAIVYNANKGNDVTYNNDTVLVTPTRLANAVYAGTANGVNGNDNLGSVAHAGWVRTRTFTGGRAGRVQNEVLVALANPVAANTLSGNTSNSLTYFTGV